MVLKCLQKDPARRYQSAAEVVADLERIIAGNLSITAVFNAKYGTGADEAMRRYLGRGRRWIAPTVAALLAVSLAAGGGAWWWQARADERLVARRDLERLRTELRASLDAAQALPASASADVERIAALAGGEDPDVVRWRAKISRVGLLTGLLGRLDQATLADASLAGESRADLDALTALVGESYPGADRWRRRLQDTAVEISRLRTVLGALDRSSGISLAQREELATDLGRFASLAGEQDADLVRWRGRMAATDARLAALAATLAELDGAGTPSTEARILQLGGVLDEYLALRGVGHVDEQASRWKALIEARRAHLAGLRTSLARLDEVAVVSDGTRARLDKELVEYAGLVGADDAGLGRWRRLLADSERAIGALRGSCAVLEQADALPQAQLDTARADLETLRPLVAGDDAQVRRWSAALAVIDDRRNQDEAALAVLAAEGAVTLVQQIRAEQAIESLDARGLLREDAKIAYRRRIIAEQERLAGLKRSLSVADDPRVETTPGLVDGVLLYGRLAGTEDADYKRWYAHVIRAVQVREALAPLDRAVPVPERARELLTEYVAILGDDERVRSWRGKVDRVADLRRMLAPLDRPAPMPDDGLERLEELLALIGPFPGSESWRIKLTAIRELRGNLARELAPTAVRLAPEARTHLASLGALIGVEDERVRTWNRRLAWLAGPGQPAWATRYAVDAAGPRALLVVPGEPAVEIEFRYVPPGRFTMGSPADEAGRDADEPQVEVILTKGYWLAVHEARQDLWQRITGRSPSMDEDPAGPVDRVSWDEVQAFLVAFNALVPGVSARLPTEAEWEHAARAGEDGPYHGPFGATTSESLSRLAWFAGGEDPGDGVRSAGRRQPNALGLHDLQGNVWEWCQDRYGYYSPVPVIDPIGFEREERVLRGGSWGDSAERIRVANRLALGPGFRSWYVGFRLAITAEMPPEVRLDRNEAREAEGEASSAASGPIRASTIPEAVPNKTSHP